LEPILQQINSN